MSSYTEKDFDVSLNMEVNDLSMLEHWMNKYVLPRLVRNLSKERYNDKEDTLDLLRAARITNKIACRHHDWLKDFEKKKDKIEAAQKESKGVSKQ
jgi:hypothetical protein